MPSLVQAQNAPYVNAAVADTEFHRITAADMDVIRSKKVLFATRSYGQNLYNGLVSLANKNPMHNLLNSYVRYDVFSAGGNLGVIPPDAFHNYNFVHFMRSPSPPADGIYETDRLIRNFPHYFKDNADAVMIYEFASDSAITYGPYTTTMDSLRASFPYINVIYSTGALFDPRYAATDNIAYAQYNAAVRSRYKGRAPFYDLAYMQNNDSACGDNMCANYTTDPAGTHPNTEFIQERLAKGFLVMLYKLYCMNTVSCTSATAPTVPAGLSGSGVSLFSTRITWQASTQSPCGVNYYKIKRDNAEIGVSYSLGYSDHSLVENTQHSYEVAAVSNANVTSAFCAAVNVRTLNDSIPPRILAVPTTIRPTEVVITFSEKLDSASAGTAANYNISGGVSIVSATLLDSVVTLVTSALPANVSCTLTVNNVVDLSRNHNMVAVNSRATFKYSAKSIQSDMSGHWTYDDTLRDFSGSNNHGVWIGSAAYGLGKLGRGLNLDGTAGGGYVRVPDAATLKGMPQLTFALWAKKKSAASGGTALIKHVVYILNIGSNSFDGYVFNDASIRGNYGATVPSINDTNWHHYCVVYNGATVTGYVDGAAKSSSPLTGIVSLYNTDLYVGKDLWGNSFNGAIDDFRMYNWALDSGEVVALKNLSAGGNADSLAVRAILDANGLFAKTVGGTAVFDSTGRVVTLFLQEGGTTQLTSHIGQLTELQTLNCYGDWTLSFPLLISVAPEIGNCTKLTTLKLNINNLASLPVEITKLKNLTNLSLGDNQLCSLPDTIKNWATMYDPDWAATQTCTNVRPDHTATSAAPFLIRQTVGQITITRGMLTGVLDADIYTTRGRLVYSIQGCPGNEMIWRTDTAPSGIYFVRVTNGTVSEVKRIVIVR
jgi:hypothetical protein